MTDALERSISIWEKKAELKPGDPISLGTQACPLCRTHYNSFDCGNCPVKLRTNKDRCYETPYHDVVDHTPDYFVTEASLPHIKREVAFLKTLRPGADRIDIIEAAALQLYPDADYRDMIHDELTTDPTRTDETLAHLVAQRYAFP